MNEKKGLSAFIADFRASLKGETRSPVSMPQRILGLPALARQTLMIDDEVFFADICKRDPIYDRLSSDQWRALLEQAIDLGKSYVEEVRPYNRDWKNAVKHLKIDYKEALKPPMPDRVVFAQFVEPNQITVFTDAIHRFCRKAKGVDLPGWLTAEGITGVLVAHELFHYFEYRDEKHMATRTTKVVTHQFGPITLHANPSCLSEVAAMSFAKEWMGIGNSPCVLDVLLIYPYEPAKATSVLERIQEGNRIDKHRAQIAR